MMVETLWGPLGTLGRLKGYCVKVYKPFIPTVWLWLQHDHDWLS